MRTYDTLSSAPCMETCVQVSKHEDYLSAMKEEVQRYVEMLKLRFPFAAQMIEKKSFSHDFGTYYEAVIYFDNSIKDEMIMSLFIVDHTPETWDETIVYYMDDAIFYWEEKELQNRKEYFYYL